MLIKMSHCCAGGVDVASGDVAGGDDGGGGEVVVMSLVVMMMSMVMMAKMLTTAAQCYCGHNDCPFCNLLLNLERTQPDLLM